MHTLNLSSLIHDLTIPCADNGHEFIRTDRISRIAELLTASSYLLLDQLPLAFVWKHRDFNPDLPVVLVSSHIDSLYTRYHCCLENGLFLGTFDNSITNAAIIDRMLGNHLPPQVLVAFTGDEEENSRGADQVMEILKSAPKPLHPEMVVVLDITEEAYKSHPFTFENLFRQKAPSPLVCLRFAEKKDLAAYLRATLDTDDLFIIKNGEPDESWQYDEHDVNCCALCLPILTVTGDMHDDSGVYAKEQSVFKYTETLSRFLSKIVAELQTIPTPIFYPIE